MLLVLFLRCSTQNSLFGDFSYFQLHLSEYSISYTIISASSALVCHHNNK